jgi:CheY-like chemotaxis protein
MFPQVLVVDDSPVDRRLVEGLLSKDPFLRVEFASDGLEALRQIDHLNPDLVLTDLRMPEMDGLELVKAISVDYPLLPVILMTAHGSGALALEALDFGASCFVPKSQLADRLVDVVQRMLRSADAHRNLELLMDYQDRAEFSFSVENKPSLVDPLSALIQNNVSCMRLFPSQARIQIAVAFEQAFLNALYHGNLELSHDDIARERRGLESGQPMSLVEHRRNQHPYCDRRINVCLSMCHEAVRIVVRDEGPGFDSSLIPDSSDPTELEREGGHGLVLMQAFMDEVSFNDLGNEVTMIKRPQKQRNRRRTDSVRLGT